MAGEREGLRRGGLGGVDHGKITGLHGRGRAGGGDCWEGLRKGGIRDWLHKWFGLKVGTYV
jgi:hypothetical protein